jgi:hypothetical protein
MTTRLFGPNLLLPIGFLFLIFALASRVTTQAHVIALKRPKAIRPFLDLLGDELDRVSELLGPAPHVKFGQIAPFIWESASLHIVKEATQLS